MKGDIKEILISESAGGEIVRKESIELEVGRGIVGDRYYNGVGTFSKKLEGLPDVEITLIEQEEIEAFNSGRNYSGQHFRRNIVTLNVRLNDLVGKEFMVGRTKLRGIRLCEPCAYLANIIGHEIMEHMVHKCGIRASVVLGGIVNNTDKLYI